MQKRHQSKCLPPWSPQGQVPCFNYNSLKLPWCGKCFRWTTAQHDFLRIRKSSLEVCWNTLQNAQLQNTLKPPRGWGYFWSVFPKEEFLLQKTSVLFRTAKKSSPCSRGCRQSHREGCGIMFTLREGPVLPRCVFPSPACSWWAGKEILDSGACSSLWMVSFLGKGFHMERQYFASPASNYQSSSKMSFRGLPWSDGLSIDMLGMLDLKNSWGLHIQTGGAVLLFKLESVFGES